MLWETSLSKNHIEELTGKGALRLGHYIKKYSRGRSGQWQELKHTRLFLDDAKEYELFLIGNKKMGDSHGVYYLKNSATGFSHNGRLSYGSFIFAGDRIVLNQEIYDFKSTIQESNSSLALLNDEIISSHSPVLLVGETGTGKGFLAQKITELRKHVKPWVHVNLAALAPSLLESEIFGHVKGAFTGAVYENKGALKSADQTVLFFDEIDSLPLEIQTKLLLFLDDYRFKPVGASREEKVQVKLIVASGKPLEPLVALGHFRKDLYYRLKSGHSIHLPTLKERPELIAEFCQGYCEKHQLIIDTSLVDFYQKQSWPGNYRQLKSHLDHKYSVARKTRHLRFDEVDQNLLNLPQFLCSYAEKEYDSEYLSLDEVKKNYAKMLNYKLGNSIFLTSSILKVSVKTTRNLLT